MANGAFLTTFTHPRDPKSLWPIAAGVSVLTHALGLVLVRPLALQALMPPQGSMAPLPIQLVTLPPAPPAAAAAALPEAAAAPAPLPTAPADPVAIAPQTAAPPVASPPQVPAPQPVPAPAAPPAPAVAPAPPRPVPPAVPAPAVSAPPVAPPPVSSPPDPPAAGVGDPGSPAASPGGAAQGGQVVPVGLRLNPSGRDIPETAPQLLDAAAIAVRPLAAGCGFANLDALLSGLVSATVQLQLRVESSGAISDVQLLQGTGNPAVDDLVRCVVQQRLRLQPASSAGVPQLTDAYILDARVEF